MSSVNENELSFENSPTGDLEFRFGSYTLTELHFGDGKFRTSSWTPLVILIAIAIVAFFWRRHVLKLCKKIKV